MWHDPSEGALQYRRVVAEVGEKLSGFVVYDEGD